MVREVAIVGLSGQLKLPGAVRKATGVARGQRWEVVVGTSDYILVRSATAFGDLLFVGRLDEVYVPDLVGFIVRGRMTGTLEVVSGLESKRIFFSRGEVKGATSSTAENRLGELLVRKGRITPEQRDSALKQVKPGRPLGRVLVESGVTTQADVFSYVRLQVEEIFHGALLFAQGHFALFNRYNETDFPAVVTINTEALLREATRRAQDLARTAAAIGLPSNIPKRVIPAPSTPVSDFQRKVLAEIDGKKTVLEIARRLVLGELEAVRVISLLVQGGHINVESTTQAKPALSQPQSASTVTTVVETFNAIFCEIFSVMKAHGRSTSFRAAVSTFLASVPAEFSTLYEGVTFGENGAINTMALLKNLAKNSSSAVVQDETTFLESALNELLFFELFEVRDSLPPDDEAQLLSRIRQIQAMG